MSTHPKLKNVIESLHSNLERTVQFNDRSSEPFDIHSDDKAGYVFTPILYSGSSSESNYAPGLMAGFSI